MNSLSLISLPSRTRGLRKKNGMCIIAPNHISEIKGSTRLLAALVLAGFPALLSAPLPRHQNREQQLTPFVLVPQLGPPALTPARCRAEMRNISSLIEVAGGRHRRQECNYLSWNRTKPQGLASPSPVSSRAHYLPVCPQSNSEITQEVRYCFLGW